MRHDHDRLVRIGGQPHGLGDVGRCRSGDVRCIGDDSVDLKLPCLLKDLLLIDRADIIIFIRVPVRRIARQIIHIDDMIAQPFRGKHSCHLKIISAQHHDFFRHKFFPFLEKRQQLHYTTRLQEIKSK